MKLFIALAVLSVAFISPPAQASYLSEFMASILRSEAERVVREEAREAIRGTADVITGDDDDYYYDDYDYGDYGDYNNPEDLNETNPSAEPEKEKPRYND